MRPGYIVKRTLDELFEKNKKSAVNYCNRCYGQSFRMSITKEGKMNYAVRQILTGLGSNPVIEVIANCPDFDSALEAVEFRVNELR